MTHRRAWPALLAFLLTATLGACLPSGGAGMVMDEQGRPGYVDWVQRQEDGPAVAGEALGQTFVCRHDGLIGVDVAIDPGAGRVTLRLLDGPGGALLRSAEGAALPDEAWTRFRFTPLPDSHGGRYYLELVGAGDAGPLTVRAGPAGAYRDGALYLDGAPQEAQMAFRLVHEPRQIVGGLVRWLAAGLLPGLGVAALLILPGAALLAWLQPAEVRRRAGALEQAILAACLGAALPPLAMLAARTAGVRVGEAGVYGLLILSAAALLVRPAAALRGRAVGQGGETAAAPERHPGRAEDGPWRLAAWVVVGLTVAVRVWVLRSLRLPLWGDSIEHTAIVQLMLDQGGLFSSWLPYTPFASFTTHFGFHATSSTLAWLLDAGASQAVLLGGQVWNVLAVLAVYPLAVRLMGRGRAGQWAGLGAIAVAGLISPLPMGYLNWGRYAQLAGLALLAAGAALLWDVVETRRPHGGAIVMAALALASAFLAYYRTPFFYLAFLPALAVGALLPRLGRSMRGWLSAAGRMAPVGGIAALLAVPWLLTLSGGVLGEGLALTTSQGAGLAAGQVLAGYQEWRIVTALYPPALLAAAGLALACCLAWRRWAAASAALWAAGMAAIHAGQIAGLPGAAMVTHFSVQISLYLPIALLIGGAVGHLGGVLTRNGRGLARGKRLPAWALAALLACAGVWGAGQRLGDLDLSYTIATRPDEAAMDWIRDNSPAEAVFLVNGFTVYDGLSAVGSDGGWWLPLLAGRPNTMPPQYALFNEQAVDPTYPAAVVELVKQLRAHPLPSAEGLAAACEMGVTHLYVGQLQGRAGKPPPEPLFTAAELLPSPAVEPVYHEDRVWVFALSDGVCSE